MLGLSLNEDEGSEIIQKVCNYEYLSTDISLYIVELYLQQQRCQNLKYRLSAVGDFRLGMTQGRRYLLEFPHLYLSVSPLTPNDL
jgi:hypothetical protein